MDRAAFPGPILKRLGSGVDLAGFEDVLAHQLSTSGKSPRLLQNPNSAVGPGL
jgi:hypothetical protein